MNKQTWNEFSDAGMLWWINRIIHTFNWSIVYEADADGTITSVYPARTTWLGFSEETDEKRLTQFRNHIETTLAAPPKELGPPATWDDLAGYVHGNDALRDVLDELVTSTAEDIGSSVNNSGPEEQIDWLVKAGWSRPQIWQAMREAELG